MINIISGGAHTGRSLDIQDLLVLPVGAERFAEAIEMAWRVRRGSAAALDVSVERDGDIPQYVAADARRRRVV